MLVILVVHVHVHVRILYTCTWMHMCIAILYTPVCAAAAGRHAARRGRRCGWEGAAPGPTRSQTGRGPRYGSPDLQREQHSSNLNTNIHNMYNACTCRPVQNSSQMCETSKDHLYPLSIKTTWLCPNIVLVQLIPTSVKRPPPY